MAESRRRARPKSQEGFFRRLFPRYENTSVDLTFLVMVILLLVFGLVMMFSASYAQGYYREGNSYHYIVRQLLWAVVGLGAMFVFSRMDYHVWRAPTDNDRRIRVKWQEAGYDLSLIHI